MAQLLVPDRVFLVCTDGMTTNQLKVTSQSSVLMAGGRPVATRNDRMTSNFNCAKMVMGAAIAGAIIGAVLAAATILTGGTVWVAAGVAAAATVGTAGAGLLAGMLPCICAILTSNWVPYHPLIVIQKVHYPILESSKMTCCLGGTVEICYSKEKAEALQDYKRMETVMGVAALTAASALVGCAFGSLLSSIGSVGSSLYATFSEFGAKAGLHQFGGIAAKVTLSGVIGEGINTGYKEIKRSSGLDDYITGKAYGKNIEENTFNRAMEYVSSPLRPVGNLKYAKNAKKTSEAIMKSQIGVYNSVTYSKWSTYKTVFVASPDGVVTPTSNMTFRKEVEVRNNIGNGSISNRQKSVSYPIANATTTGTTQHLVLEEEVSGVLYKNDKIAMAKDVMKGQLKGGLTGLAKSLLKDSIRALGNFMLSTSLKQILTAEETEQKVKDSINVQEDRI